MIEYLHETGSTNADLLHRLRAGDAVPEGHWIVADRQTDGRGRQGREWFDGIGNFMGSTLVRCRAGDPAAQTLFLVAGLAAYEAVAWHAPDHCEVSLKWPNDLMANGAKIVGILIEAAADTFVIGIGVNLVSAPDVPGRKVAALSDFGTAPDRNVFADDIARCFAAELERWRTTGTASLIRRWCAVAHPPGTRLDVHEPGGRKVSGSFEGLAEDGALRLRLADGALRAIHAGDVLLAGDGED